jgi:folate-binding protein YgfZ
VEAARVTPVAAEEEALRLGAGLLRPLPRATWRVTGADRAEYLHRMLTQDVKGLAPGRVALACVLTARGRILGDPWVANLGDALLLDLDVRGAALAIPALERTVIADDVAFEDETSRHARLSLVAKAGGRGGEAQTTWTALLAGAETRVLAVPFGGRPRRELLVPPPAERAVAAALVSAGAVEVGEAAFDAARVDEGVPAFGAEIDDGAMPLEVALGGTAISWTKGCYPGQEPVVMARHRGHPARLLVRVRFDAPVAAGADLLVDGRPVGRVTTATGLGPPRGLALLRHAEAKAGARLALSTGGEAVVEAVL